jgi:hypothetical protein
MQFGFFPNLDTATFLRVAFKRQLKSSYGDLLLQLQKHDDILFPEELTLYFLNLEEGKFNGFHSHVYHRSISLLEASDFRQVATLLKLVAENDYGEKVGFVSQNDLDISLRDSVFHSILSGADNHRIRALPLTTVEERNASSQLSRGIQKLTETYPEFSSELSRLVDSISFFSSGGDTNERALSVTAHTVQSLILINGKYDPSWIFLLDKYVHEGAHTYLFAINLQEELVLNTEEKLYSSPLRKTARSMSGVYHATFVIQRLILALSSVFAKAVLSDNERIRIKDLLDLYHSRLPEGQLVIKQHAKLSTLAKNLIDEGYESAISLKAMS